MNNPLCPSCFKSATYAIKPSAMTYPASLEPSLLSPTVLASIGAGLCKSQHLPPVIGIAIGTLAGMTLSLMQDKDFSQKPCLQLEHSCASYFCQNCQSVFTPKPTVLDSMAEFS